MLGKFTSAVQRLGIFTLLSCVMLFSQAQSQSMPNAHRYVLQPNDEIVVQYRYTPEFNQTIKIQPDGFVTLDLVGELKVGGLTLTQARSLITEKASTRLRDPEVGLALRDFEAPHFLVGGEVIRPGKFELRSNTSALQAVLLAGGFSNDAKTARVVVFRRVNPALFEVMLMSGHIF